VPGDHQLFICGNDEAAKAEVTKLLVGFGWPTASVLDLGEIDSACGMEMCMLLWLGLYGRFGTGDLNIQVHVA
jgi:8-hydroxy-5-deazaflavin:NADPH oxidoreductase